MAVLATGEPERFDPHRWTADFEQTLSKGAFFPLGPRTCIGNGFAQMEAQLLVATIAQHWTLELLDTPKIASGSPTLGFAQPIQVRVKRRG